MRMVLLLEISTPFKVQAEWPRMDVIVLTLVLSNVLHTNVHEGVGTFWRFDVLNGVCCALLSLK